MADFAQGEQLGEKRGVRLAAFSKAAIRAYLPIRDTSRWLGKELPKNWAQIAEEPMNWSDLFTEEAATIQPAPKRVTSLLKSYRYANQNFGAAIAATTIQRIVEQEEKGYAPWEAAEEAYKSVIDDFVNNANEEGDGEQERDRDNKKQKNKRNEPPESAAFHSAFMSALPFSVCDGALFKASVV